MACGYVVAKLLLFFRDLKIPLARDASLDLREKLTSELDCWSIAFQAGLRNLGLFSDSSALWTSTLKLKVDESLNLPIF